MKIFSLLYLCTISVLSFFQKSSSYNQNDNPAYLYIGMENRYYIEDSLIQNTFIISSEAEVLKKDKYFIIRLKSEIEKIHFEVCDIRNNDTVKIKTLILPVKKIPNPFFSIEGKLVKDSISKSALLKAKKIDVSLGDPFLDKQLYFELKCFDLEVQGKQFHSNSNYLTSSMIYWIKDSKSSSIRIRNDIILLKTGDKYPRVIYSDKTFYLLE